MPKSPSGSPVHLALLAALALILARPTPEGAGKAVTDSGAPFFVTVQAAQAMELTATPTPQPGIGIAWMPESVTRWSDKIVAAAERHGVDPKLVAIITLVESGGNPGARSSAGALGLMQVMPTTASGIAAARGLGWEGPNALLDPSVGIDFGTWYISRQLASFGRDDDPDWQNSVEMAAIAYNGGPGTASKFLKGAGLPNETQRYQTWVGGMWRERNGEHSPTYQSWWTAGGGRMVEAAMAR